MSALFSDLVGDGLEIFMDDFSIFSSTFDACLEKLKNILQICIENNLVLSWEKSHFIVLGHRVSKHGLEVDKAKIEVIKQLPLPNNLKRLKGFLGHMGFYRRFIKDFAKNSKNLTNLLSKDVNFIMNDDAFKAFNLIKDSLMQAPVCKHQIRIFLLSLCAMYLTLR